MTKIFCGAVILSNTISKDMKQTVWSKCTFNRVVWSRSDFIGAEFKDCEFKGCLFHGCGLAGAKFINCRGKVDFRFCNLTGSSILSPALTGGIIDCSLREVNFNCALTPGGAIVGVKCTLLGMSG